MSSGGLNRYDKAAASGTCTEWRRAVFVSRIPAKLDSKGAGRKWLQGWYHAFERQIAGVPRAVVGGDGSTPRPSLDVDAGEALHRALNEVVNNGVMPDFSHPGALVHYTLENLQQRSQKATAAMLLDEARPLLEALMLSRREVVRVAAVGGGPGFEAVGLAALAQHLRSVVSVESISMDIEKEWAPLLASVVAGATFTHATPDELHASTCSLASADAKSSCGGASSLRHRVAFVQSDCLTGHAGPDLLSAAPQVDLFTFNYCMVENAKALRRDKFAYLRQVFAAAQIGAVFVFMDAAYHLWEETVGVFGELPGMRFAVLHPHPQPWQCKSTMLVVKVAGVK